MNNGKFLNIQHVPYHEMGVSTYLDIVRTPAAISIIGKVNGGSDQPGGLTFHACSEAGKASLQSNGGCMSGDGLRQYLSAMDMAQDQLRNFNEILNGQRIYHRGFVLDFEESIANADGDQSALIDLAMRPLNMSQDNLEYLTGLLAHYVQKMDRSKGYFATLRGSFDHWCYEVLVNLMAEINVSGSDEELEDRFFAMAHDPLGAHEDDPIPTSGEVVPLFR